jgi:ABC-type transport system involved in cytochrome c biogenesis permease subunit
MLDNLKDKKIEELNANLGKLTRQMGSYWLALGKGLLYGFGTVLGAGVAIILIGWFLNIIGVIPALKSSADSWRSAFQQTQEKTILPSDNATVQPSQ